MTMKQIEVTVRGIPLDYPMANAIAHSVARLLEQEPTIVAWHDGPQHRMSPVIEGADVQYRWRDYGETHGGDFAVSVNGDFDFIFADSAKFDKLEPSPYLAVRDRQGHEYLCLPEDLRDPSNPRTEACIQVEDTGGRLSGSGLHEG